MLYSVNEYEYAIQLYKVCYTVILSILYYTFLQSILYSCKYIMLYSSAAVQSILYSCTEYTIQLYI